MKKIRQSLLSLMLAAALAAFAPQIIPARSNILSVEAASPKLNKDALHLTYGKTYRLKVKGTKKKIKWSTGSKKVATVSKNGRITTKGLGATYITAKMGSKKLKCKLLVTYKNWATTDGKYETFIGTLKKITPEHMTMGRYDTYILQLLKPVYLFSSYGTMEKVMEIQLIPKNNLPQKYINQNIIVYGNTMEAITAWHIRPIVLVDTKLIY